MKSLSIEQLAEKLGGKLWIKEDKKRIYLDRGYNTKKMSTKTYVYQREDGSFGVSCYIDCPSQPFAWIKSQQEEVIESVKSDIEEAMIDTYYLIVEEATGEYIDHDCKKYTLNFFGSNDRYLTEEAAQEFIKTNQLKGFSVKEMDRDEFDKEVARLDELERPERERVAAEANAKREIEEKAASSLKKEEIKKIRESIKIPDNATRVKHAKFGLGTVITSDSNIMQILFDNDEFGLKKLMTAFVKLETVSND